SDLFELDQSTGEIYLMRKIRDLAGQQLSIPYNQINRSTYESEDKLIEFEIGNGSVDAPYFDEEIVHVTVAEDAPIDDCGDSGRSQRCYRPMHSDFTPIDLGWPTAPHHLVVVAAAGGGKASQLVVISVDDKNNNHPEIISGAEVLVFTEPSNRVIHYVVATDDDSGPNAAISYDLISDPTDCFGIDHKT
ncbi:hypothetical protein OSTOST_24465, partial [Ostertagia ostertagi]